MMSTASCSQHIEVEIDTLKTVPYSVRHDLMAASYTDTQRKGA